MNKNSLSIKFAQGKPICFIAKIMCGLVANMICYAITLLYSRK